MISVTNLAKAAVAGQIRPKFLSGQGFFGPFGMFFGLPSGEFVDDATAQQLAQLLEGEVVKLQARGTWINGEPNTSPFLNVPLENFIGFPGQPGAPHANSLMVVNCGDIVGNACCGYYFMNRELAAEEALANLIPNAVMSPEAGAALVPPNPIANWPPTPAIWFTPQV